MTAIDGDLRPLRRPLRAGDADPGARRARRRPGRRRSAIPPTRPSWTSSAAPTSGARRRSRSPPRFAPGKRALPQARGPEPHRRAQDQQRARPGRARAAARQDADHRRDGRGPARRRDRDRVRAVRARVRRLHGLRGHAPPGAERRADAPARRRPSSPVEFGTRTLKEATSEAIRDWITNVETTHYVIGSCVGPAPYPEIVRELQAVIGREAREQLLEAEGALPEAVVACVGGGSNAIGMFAGVPRRRGRAARRRRGRGRRVARHGPRRRAARLALVDPRRRGRPDRRRALDLGRARLPGRRPRARVPPRHRPRRVPALHRRGGARGVRAADAHRGDHPCARVVARARGRRRLDAEYIAVCLSGRGDKDLAEALAALASAARTRERRRSSSTLSASRRRRSSPRPPSRRRGHDRARLPVLRPARRRPRDPRALRAGARARACARRSASSASPRRARSSATTPLIPMTYASLLEAYGWERFEADAARGRRDELHRRRHPGRDSGPS